MIYLEEHREVGDGPEKAEQLAKIHEDYSEIAMVNSQFSHHLLFVRAIWLTEKTECYSLESLTGSTANR